MRLIDADKVVCPISQVYKTREEAEGALAEKGAEK